MRHLLVTVALVAAGPALAQGLDVMQMAQGLGTVLASEEACGLSYDQPAIGDWIARHVPPEDMQFPASLDLMTKGMARSLSSMTPSQKTAHCAAVTQTARRYGFIP